jgi:RimJ/RimL family protein N-acetyltransferase
MELLPYLDEDLALSLALETDPEVMRELGGPRDREGIEAVHPKRVKGAGGPWLKIVPEPGGEAAGAIGIWESEWEGETVHEAGWMLLPAYHGRGLGSEALGLLLDRARDDPRFERVHAFPGVTNGPSNGLCRKFGFELLGESTVEFAGSELRINHWCLDLTRAD